MPTTTSRTMTGSKLRNAPIVLVSDREWYALRLVLRRCRNNGGSIEDGTRYEDCGSAVLKVFFSCSFL